ncbi:hypothetical protein EMGBS15_00020 [Filimonas sp.]|nr:hypothetical protein EMGBS15_00020 [Filimonas sp.]
MKSTLRSLFLVVIFILSAWQSEANHGAAADIYYEYLSPLTYRFHLVLYQDCGPSSSFANGNPETIQGSSVSTGMSISITVDTTGNNTKKVYGDLCPNINNWCTDPNSPFPGYEEWHYTGVVVLPGAATDWRFVWSSCCRNAGISNLTGPTGLGMSVTAGLNNVVRPINNSAFLSVKPIPYVCVNQPKTYLNGPLDPDFDSLVF